MTDEEKASGLSLAQSEAISALLKGCHQGDAAAAAGVSARTVRNWWNRPEFREAYYRGRALLAQQTSVRLEMQALKAAEALTAAMNDPKARPADRVAAAKAILTLAGKGLPEPASGRGGEVDG